eukprot:1560660-Pleurochrysis_carterae.AAC.1
MDLMQLVLPVDASCEDLEVDSALGFLDGYVAEAVSKGAQLYLAPGERPDELDVGAARAAAGHSLRFDEYTRPQEPTPTLVPAGVGGMGGAG